MIARLMSGSSKSNRLSSHIEPRKQAYLQSVYEGYVTLEDLPGIEDVVNSIEEINVRLALYVEEQGLKIAEIDINGIIQVTCQRCLKPCDLEIESKSSLAIVNSEDDAKTLPDRYEPWIVEGNEADVYQIVQEELLLSIPVVAYHKENCIDPRLLESGEEEIVIGEPKENPFKVLELLKKKTPKQ